MGSVVRGSPCGPVWAVLSLETQWWLAHPLEKSWTRPSGRVGEGQLPYLVGDYKEVELKYGKQPDDYGIYLQNGFAFFFILYIQLCFVLMFSNLSNFS